MTDEQAKPSQDQIDQAHAKAEKLAARAKSDPDFVQKLKSDTVSTLTAEGLSQGAAQELATQWGGQEVSGYAQFCDYGTTWVWCTYFTY